MNAKQVQYAKHSVCKVMGVHKAFNYKEPYLLEEESQFGGTAFFIDPKLFGSNFSIEIGDSRFALTNFHVVDTLDNKTCQLTYPSKGNSCITATVIFVVPSMDVAILQIDPHGDHPLWFDSGDIRDFIQSIPNLKVNTDMIKGNSQKVVAIGFPNLSSDYQLAEGCISGRGLGMIQCTISLNGGNSGGPLMCKNKVIGICTASICESESLGLAVPISQICRFLQLWTSYNSTILCTPSWGVLTKTTTPDYMEYHAVDTAIQGCSVQKMVQDVGTLYKASIREGDILLGINSNNKRYNIDNYGLVQVPWTDKRVPIDNQEFIISLHPDDIRMDIFKWSTKRMKRNIKVRPSPIDFKIRHMYHAWEPVDYAMLGGCVFMNLSMNQLEVEDEEDEAYCPPSQVASIQAFIHKSMHMEHSVVVTHIPAQSHVSSQKLIQPFDRIIKCNGKKVKDVRHFEELIRTSVHACNVDNNTTKTSFIVLETQRDTIYLNLHKLLLKEIQDCMRMAYPKEKCQLLQLSTKKKRKRTLY